MDNEESKIICLSGAADPLHAGHLRMINDAAEYGKVVWILNSDEWLRRKKGYVFMPWAERKEILMAFEKIYDVVEVDDKEGTVCEALERVKPDYFGNGGDRGVYNTPEKKVCDELKIQCLWGLGGKKIQSSSELVDTAVDTIIEKLKNAGIIKAEKIFFP